MNSQESQLRTRIRRYHSLRSLTHTSQSPLLYLHFIHAVLILLGFTLRLPVSACEPQCVSFIVCRSRAMIIRYIRSTHRGHQRLTTESTLVFGSSQGVSWSWQRPSVKQALLSPLPSLQRPSSNDSSPSSQVASAESAAPLTTSLPVRSADASTNSSLSAAFGAGIMMRPGLRLGSSQLVPAVT